ncbi:MAG TPA: sodium-translocating pyrophosphatase [Bacteroidales bacterium]|nr:sodium-translocating pyrophosphatase [Bacteroidales bacterium]
MENYLIYLIPLTGVLALVFSYVKTRWIIRQPSGTEKMKRVSSFIDAGALAFLKAEYRTMLVFLVIISLILIFLADPEISSPLIGLSYLVGAFCSALAGYIGMRTATKANVRTAQAARTSLNKALQVAFSGGSVMGITVVGLGMIGVGSLFIIYTQLFGSDSLNNMSRVLSVITGFSFGASTVGLFARVGGGIFTKAADVGADLVGKVEAGIPEDHHLNPATIADNVGDNVGDVAGMGADLFESYVSSIISAMVIGVILMAGTYTDSFGGLSPVILPLFLGAAGVFASMAGTYFVKAREGGNPQVALNVGQIVTSLLMVVFSYFLITNLLPKEFVFIDVLYGGIERTITSFNIFLATIAGLVLGLVIGFSTEYFTGLHHLPVRIVARQSTSGPATNIISGLSMGMLSTIPPVLAIVIAIVVVFSLGGLYGIAIAAVGMLSVLGFQLSVDAYGPISDNAGGIAQLSGLPPEVRERTDQLDAVGNTTAAIGKGFAAGSAALTALALFGAYMTASNITQIDVTQAAVISTLFLGGLLPYVFSALSINAVSGAAHKMIKEVRHQFLTIEPLKNALAVLKKNGDKPVSEWSEEDQKVMDDAEGSPDYSRCVSISTHAALRQMLLPAIIALATPIIIGIWLGAEALGGLLAGLTVSAILQAFFQANAGGLWDNAKKLVEKGFIINGQDHSYGSETHKATIVGDTVGDPLKDTSGPSLDILLKLIATISLIFATSFY